MSFECNLKAFHVYKITFFLDVKEYEYFLTHNETILELTKSLKKKVAEFNSSVICFFALKLF